MELGARVHDLDLGEVAGVHDLGEELEGGGDEGLRGDDGGQDGDDQRRIEHARWNAVEERVRVCALVLGDVGGLANVGEEQTGIAEAAPGDADGASGEGAQVCEEGFDTYSLGLARY